MNVATLDRVDLENRVKEMYRQVAEEPDSTFHFEMGRALALRLGYLAWDLDVIPEGAVESFAGVGHHFGLANLKAGEFVLDLGSGSGMDTFVASQYVGLQGWVVGVDMTDAQRRKAERLMEWGGLYEHLVRGKQYRRFAPGNGDLRCGNFQRCCQLVRG